LVYAREITSTRPFSSRFSKRVENNLINNIIIANAETLQ
jgi:hypothetical protein